MASTNTYNPDYAAPPGWVLEEMLEAHALSQAEFARRCGRSPKLISEIISGRAPVEPETAIQFEMVLGMDAGIWLGIESDYKLHTARQAEAQRQQEEIEWYNSFPIAQMTAKGIIAKPESESAGVGMLLAFFGVASLGAWQRRYGVACVAYRHSDSFESSEAALATWLRMGERDAEKQDCAEFNEARFRAVLSEIRGLTTQQLDVFLPEMCRLCNSAGVAFSIVQGLQGTALSGAARWLNPRKALIQQSMRHLRNDHFWFTFFHEAAHLLLHSKKEIFVDELKGDGSELESQANRWAANFLIPRSAWSAFKASQPRSETAVLRFAGQQGIAPGIVVGMLQHDGVIPWENLNGLKRKYVWQENSK